MPIITKPKTWADNENVTFTDINSNFDTLYNAFNGAVDNTNLAPGAAIDPTKIAGTASTLSGSQTISGTKTFQTEIIQAEIATPATPASGFDKLYFKSDGQLYRLSSAGIETTVGAPASGWNSANETWAYASASTITVPTDATTKYAVGDRIRLKQGAGYLYFSVTAVAATLLTVNGGSDYTLANAAITANDYSRTNNPLGFPSVFNIAPTWTGFSVAPGGGTYVFWTADRTCYFSIENGLSGTSNATTTTITNLPFTAAASTSALGMLTDSAAGNTYGYGNVESGSTTLQFFLTAADGTFTNSGSKSVRRFTIAYPF